MADPKVRIPIELPAGDMSGAEEAKRKIEEVKDAAAETTPQEDPALVQQRIDDVAAAQKLASDRRIEQISKEIQAEKDAAQAAKDSIALRTASSAALALTAKKALDEVQAAIAGLRELSPAAAESFSTIELAIQSVQDPIGTLIEAITGTKEELRLLAESQKRAAEAEAVYLAAVKQRQEELATASRNRINTFLAAEQQAIDEQTAAYERQLRVIKAVAAAEEARAKAADALAIAGGADPQQVAAGALARQTAAGAGDADARIAEVERKLEEKERLFDAAVSALADASTSAGVTREQIAELSIAADQAQAAVADAVAEVETVRTEAEAAKATIAADAVAATQDIVDAAKDANTEAAREAKDALEAQAKEQGSEFTAGGREALKILTDALADGVIKPEELAAITVAINQAKGASAQLNSEVLAGFSTLEKTNQAAIRGLEALNARLTAQERQIESLNARIPKP